jgi:hypothetical protein
VRACRVWHAGAPGRCLAIDLPSEDAPTPMNRVDKPFERSSLPRPQANPVLCELLERLHGWSHRQRIIIVAIDQDGERPRKARSSELLAVRQRTTMARVRRQDMHEHVVVRLAIIAHQAKHLYLNRPRSAAAWRNEKIALLPPAIWIWNASLHSTIQCRMIAPKLSQDQGDRLDLGVWPDAGLIGTPPGVSGIGEREASGEVTRQPRCSQLQGGSSGFRYGLPTDSAPRRTSASSRAASVPSAVTTNR